MIHGYGGRMPRIGERCFIAPSADIIGDVEIGKGTSVWFSATIRGDLNSIRIGENVSIQDNCAVHGTKELPAVIGDDVVVGHGAIIHAATVEGPTIIGMGAILLSGSRVGKGCIIGAGSVVTEGTVIPEGSIAMGAPAKVVKKATALHMERIKANVQEYVELNARYLEEGGSGTEK